MRHTLPILLLSCFTLTPAVDAQVVFRSSRPGADGKMIEGPKVGERKFGDKPVARVWYSKITPASSMNYMREVSEEMGIPQSPLMMLPPGTSSVASSGVMNHKKTDELKGMLMYLTSGLIPTPVTLSFKRVADEKAFRKEVLQRKSTWGPAARLIGNGDRYEVKVDFQQMLSDLSPAKGDDKESADGGDEDKPKARVAIAFSTRISTGDGEPGGPPPEAPDFSMVSMSTFFRYHDGVMFEAQSMPELHKMKLPGVDVLSLSKKQQSLDIYADVDLSQIPKAYKDVFWNTIKVKANSVLQQYDEEPDEEYALRRSTGDFSMALTRAAILDVDRVRLSMNFADGDNKKPLTADLLVDARRNSNLAKLLGQVSRGVSRFDAIRKQPAPLTIASAWQMPENFRSVLKAMFEKGKFRMAEELADDTDALVAVDDLFNVLSETVDAGAADAIVKLGGDFEKGYALYGGMRVKGADRLAKHLSTALNGLPSTPENEIHVTRENDRDYLSFRLDELSVPALDGNKQLPGQLHFTVAESCLWFSVGGQTSFDVLKSCIDGINDDEIKEARGPAAPFIVDLNLSDWLKSDEAEAQNEFSKVPMQTLQRFEQAVHRSLANTFSFSMSMNGEAKKPKMGFRDSYLAKAIKSGQDELHLEVDTSPKALRAKARVGEGIIKFFVARLVEVQNRAMEGMNIQFQDADGKRSIKIEGGSGTFSAQGPDK